MLGNAVNSLDLCGIVGVKEETEVETHGIKEVSADGKEARFDINLEALVFAHQRQELGDFFVIFR